MIPKLRQGSQFLWCTRMRVKDSPQSSICSSSAAGVCLHTAHGLASRTSCPVSSARHRFANVALSPHVSLPLSLSPTCRHNCVASCNVGWHKLHAKLAKQRKRCEWISQQTHCGVFCLGKNETLELFKHAAFSNEHPGSLKNMKLKQHVSPSLCLRTMNQSDPFSCTL